MSLKKTIYQNCVILEGDQWFWSANFNALYKRNLENGNTERIGSYEEYDNAAYTKLVYYKNKLIALPYAANRIMIYDMANQEFRYSKIGIPDMEKNSGNSEKFFGAARKDNHLFMIGCKTAHVLKYNMETEQTDGYIDLYEGRARLKDGIGYLREGTFSGNRLMIPALYENSLYIVEADCLRYTRKDFPKKGKGFSTIYKDGEWIWMFPFDEGDIIQWNSDTDTVIKHEVNHLIQLKKYSRNFLSVYQEGNMLWIIPRLGNKLLSYDLHKKQFSDANAVNTYFIKEKKELAGISAEKAGKNLLLLTEGLDDILLFNTEENRIQFLKNEVPNMDFLEYLQRKTGKIVISEKEVPLDCYLKFLCC